MRYFVPWSEQSLSDAPRLAIGMVHIVQVHHYLDSLWKQALWVTIAAAAIASILYVRVLTTPHPAAQTPLRRLGGSRSGPYLDPDG